MSPSEFGVVVAAVAVLGLIYPHVLYPMVLRFISRFAAKPYLVNTAFEPTVDVCISAYNEQQVVERCLASIVAADYPRSKLRVIIGNDGSSDDTVRCIERVVQQNPNTTIVLHTFARVGKNTVVNHLISTSTADVIVFTDADTKFHADSIQQIVKPLSHPDIGASLGYVIDPDRQKDSDAGAHGEVSYRSMERIMNVMESTIASTVTSNGPLYAIKRHLVQPLTDSRMADDWANLLNVIKQKKRVVSAPEATVQDLRDVYFGGEVRRTIRTASCGMATVSHYKSLLLPTAGWVSFFLISHRIVRWCSPIFLLLAMIGTILTVSNPFVFGVLFYSQFAFYAVALLGYAGVQFGQRIPIASVCLYFVSMNAAFLGGMWKFASGRRLDTWDPSIKVPT